MTAICNAHYKDVTNSASNILILLGDRLTVGLPRRKFAQAIQYPALQILSGFPRLLTVVCNALPAPPRVGRGW